MASGDLHGLRAVVTGASKGIGYAIARRLRGDGATVLATARTVPPDLPEGIQFVAANLVSVQGCSSIAEAVRDCLGSVDIVVHVLGGSSAPAGGFAVPRTGGPFNTYSSVRAQLAASPRSCP